MINNLGSRRTLQHTRFYGEGGEYLPNIHPGSLRLNTLMYTLRDWSMKESKLLVPSTNHSQGNRIWNAFPRKEIRGYGVSMGIIRILVAILIIVVILKLL